MQHPGHLCLQKLWLQKQLVPLLIDNVWRALAFTNFALMAREARATLLRVLRARDERLVATPLRPRDCLLVYLRIWRLEVLEFNVLDSYPWTKLGLRYKREPQEMAVVIQDRVVYRIRRNREGTLD
jgi:hypothetical protein